MVVYKQIYIWEMVYKQRHIWESRQNHKKNERNERVIKDHEINYPRINIIEDDLCDFSDQDVEVHN